MLKEVFQAEEIRYSKKYGFTQSNEKIRNEINDDQTEYFFLFQMCYNRFLKQK